MRQSSGALRRGLPRDGARLEVADEVAGLIADFAKVDEFAAHAEEHEAIE